MALAAGTPSRSEPERPAGGSATRVCLPLVAAPSPAGNLRLRQTARALSPASESWLSGRGGVSHKTHKGWLACSRATLALADNSSATLGARQHRVPAQEPVPPPHARVRNSVADGVAHPLARAVRADRRERRPAGGTRDRGRKRGRALVADAAAVEAQRCSAVSAPGAVSAPASAAAPAAPTGLSSRLSVCSARSYGAAAARAAAAAEPSRRHDRSDSVSRARRWAASAVRAATPASLN